MSVADGLPAPLGAELLGSAREAFTTGLNTAAGAGVAVFVPLAILAIATLRHVPPTGESQPEETGHIPTPAPETEQDPADTPVPTSG